MPFSITQNSKATFVLVLVCLVVLVKAKGRSRYTATVGKHFSDIQNWTFIVAIVLLLESYI